MKITNLLVFGFAAVAAAEDSSCLSEDQGQKILARYISSFVNPKLHTVNLTFTRNFKYYSDSNDFLAGLPPASSTGVPYYANRVELYNDQVRTAENNAQSFKDVGFKILQSTIGCDTITFRWRFEATYTVQPPDSTSEPGDIFSFGGIDYMFLKLSTKPPKVKTAYSEFNVGELLYTSGYPICFQKNANVTCAPANSTTSASSTKFFQLPK